MQRENLNKSYTKYFSYFKRQRSCGTNTMMGVTQCTSYAIVVVCVCRSCLHNIYCITPSAAFERIMAAQLRIMLQWSYLPQYTYTLLEFVLVSFLKSNVLRYVLLVGCTSVHRDLKLLFRLFVWSATLMSYVHLHVASVSITNRSIHQEISNENLVTHKVSHHKNHKKHLFFCVNQE